MSTVTISLGDSIPSLAKDNGFFPDTIWNHPQNAGLRSKRKSQNQLYPGDEVFIPELRKGTDATVYLPTYRTLRVLPPLQPLGQESHKYKDAAAPEQPHKSPDAPQPRAARPARLRKPGHTPPASEAPTLN